MEYEFIEICELLGGEPVESQVVQGEEDQASPYYLVPAVALRAAGQIAGSAVQDYFYRLFD